MLVRAAIRRGLSAATLCMAAGSNVVWGNQIWSVDTGQVTIGIDMSGLGDRGVIVEPLYADRSANAVSELRFGIGDSTLELKGQEGALVGLPQGEIQTTHGLVFSAGERTLAIKQPSIRAWSADGFDRLVIVDATAKKVAPLLDLGSVKLGFDSIEESIQFETAELTMAAALADALGDAGLEGVSVGGLSARAYLTWSGGEQPAHWARPGFVEADPKAVDGETIAGGNNGTDCWNNGEPMIGPDVIVGDLIDITNNYGSVGGIRAYAVGTTSCNIGSQNLLWVDDTPNVPVIGQNMFRLKNNRFEQIGQSWLKYAFTALTQNVCGCGCNGNGGTVLGVGCSDPYCCGLNGQWGNLGPKYQVNAFTGAHPGTPAGGPTPNSIARRLQVAISDLDPALDGGGLYFVEGQYVTPDDAAAGNHFNNASYRSVTVTAGSWNVNLASTTRREQPAIRAWQDTDPTVTESDVLIPNEGLVIVASKATNLGTGYYHYEYAVQNLNSDRSVGSFTVPFRPGTDIQNVGFHDVPYHSGEIFDGTDWTATEGTNSITWETTPFNVNPNANAIRWGTLYNFRFDANMPPYRTEVTLGLFKPGSPTSLMTSADGPVLCIPEDCVDENPCTTDVCGGAACQFVNNNDLCDDDDPCTSGDICSNGACAGTPAPVLYGDVSPTGGDGNTDVGDVLCVLSGFDIPSNCPGGDIDPCGGDGDIDIGDILMSLQIFEGGGTCPDPCPP